MFLGRTTVGGEWFGANRWTTFACGSTGMSFGKMRIVSKREKQRESAGVVHFFSYTKQLIEFRSDTGYMAGIRSTK